MAIDFEFRERAIKSLTNEKGVYVLCDLDGVPVYVGKSRNGIRARVRRHLTSARSDIIANRQIDVWEVAWVWAFPIEDLLAMGELETALFHKYDPISALMNGHVPSVPDAVVTIPEPAQRIQVMASPEIHEKRDAALRLPRQAGRYAELVEHFVAVKNSSQVARAMQAHFARLSKYHQALLLGAVEDSGDED